MVKFLKYSAILLVSVVLLFGAAQGVMFVYFMFNSPEQTMERFLPQLGSGKKYANKVVQPIVSNWNKEMLIRHSTKEFADHLTNSKMSEQFDIYEKVFGKAQAYSDCMPLNGEFSNGEGWLEVGCPVTFVSGPATIAVTLQHKGDNWKISDFGVNVSMGGGAS